MSERQFWIFMWLLVGVSLALFTLAGVVLVELARRLA